MADFEFGNPQGVAKPIADVGDQDTTFNGHVLDVGAAVAAMGDKFDANNLIRSGGPFHIMNVVP